MKIPFLDKILNRGEEIPEQVFQSTPIGAKDIAAPSSIKVSQDNIKLGERYVKSFFVFSFPRYLSTGWLSPVINMDSPMDVSMFVHPMDSEEILKKLRKRTAEVQSEIAEREEKGLVRSPELETAYKDLEDLRDKLQTAREKMFHFSLYITIYGENEQDLQSTETRLRSVLESRMIYPKPALFQEKDGFLSSIPYGTDKLSVANAMNTAPLSSSFPFISFDLSSNEGILYGVNKHNNSLVLFDRFSLENANSLVFGKSGSGKSIKGNESVLIKEDGEVKQTQIGQLIDGLISEKHAQQIDQETEGVIRPDLKVFTFNKDLEGEWSSVKVAARKEAPDTFYKFKTQSGREITTTGDHNLVALKKGKLTITQSSEAKAGDFIPLPRKVSNKDSTSKKFNLLKLLENSENIYVSEASDIIKENYQKLKETKLDSDYDPYLYEYKVGRSIPLSYFQKIISCLNLDSTDKELENLKIVSRTGKNNYSLDINLTVNDSLLKLAGYITAEGTIRDDMIIISNGDPKVLKEAEQAFKEIGVPFHYRETAIVCMSRIFIEIVKKLHGKAKSSEKRAWPLIFNLDQQQISTFLSTYFEGDGTVGDNGEVTATSKSKRLISDLSYLLLRFGIVARIRKKFKKATNSDHQGDYYYQIVISGQENLKKFEREINFITDRKRNKLRNRLKQKGNTNVDIIPELDSTFQEIQELFAPLLYNIQEAHDWKRGVKNPSPQHLKKTIGKIRAKIDHFKSLEHQYKILNELPELNSIIKKGKTDKELNSELWSELGDSWRLMKNKEVHPGSKNTFKAINLVESRTYSLVSLKNKIHSGFQELNLSVKDYNRPLQDALVENLEGDTRYQTLQGSAQFVWENYQDILQNKIPEVENKLDQLETLADSDLFWDPIVKVEEIKNEDDQYVYDLEVDNGVFLAGYGGMFVHNSFFQKAEILRSLMMGTDVIIIDPENEYKFLSEAVGGSYFNMSLTSPNHVNPFDLPPPRENEKPEDILRSNIINLVGLLRIMLGGLSAEEDAIIDQALAETYRARDITPETDPSLWRERVPLMEDFQSVLETMEGAESLVRRLRKFTEGSYSDFFNQPTNVDMDNNLVCFGIRDMEDELRPMAMFIIMRYIWNAIRANLKKRILVVDEAWWMMKNEDGASFLFGTAKRARKYWLGVTTITQDVIDFMKSEYGKPIITNSSLQFLMKQSPSGAEAVQDAFNLTEAEKTMLLEAPVGEGLFFAGPKHVGLRVVASYTEEQIITSSPEEVQKIKESKRELGQQSSKDQSRIEQGEF